MRVASVHLYPVKATAGLAVDSATVEPGGLRHDRRWAIVDGDGKRLNATHHDSLLRVVAQPDAAGNLTVSVDGRDPVFVRLPSPAPRSGSMSPASHMRSTPVMRRRTGSASISNGPCGWSGRTTRRSDRCRSTTVAPERSPEPRRHRSAPADVGVVAVATQ